MRRRRVHKADRSSKRARQHKGKPKTNLADVYWKMNRGIATFISLVVSQLYTAATQSWEKQTMKQTTNRQPLQLTNSEQGRGMCVCVMCDVMGYTKLRMEPHHAKRA